jgi:putative CocE/NonD family hydrolase
LSVLSRLVGRFANLPRAETYDVVVERVLPAEMPDSVVLLADRYFPRGSYRLPTILVRTPYGRGGFFGFVFARLYAERGFQVVIQSTRGTADSGGQLDPFGPEHDDGLATLAWIKRQPWFDGRLATNGPSYLGYVQWAIAREAGSDVQAMCIQVSASQFRDQTYTGRSFALDTALSWTNMMADPRRSASAGQTLGAGRKLRPLFFHLPLRDVDALATGHHVPFFQEWLEHTEPGDEYWRKRDFSAGVKEITTPINFIGGWYDIFLPWMLRDYRTLKAAGQQPYLTIGPWAHASMGLMKETLHETLAWFRAHLLEDRSALRRLPVRLFVTGQNRWREFSDWPPPGTMQRRYHLQPGSGLATDSPPASEPDRYLYNPANPTPSVAGPVLMGRALPTDNRRLEGRPDVLTYTTVPLEQDMDVIGPVQADLYVRSSLQHTDFFVRLCDVDARGKSINVCDALQRVSPAYPETLPDGTLRVTFDLWPTAHRFRKGHRVRVQVSSGAHPRYARNTGSGEPLGSATKLILADQSIYHDPEHPSGIVLSLLRD